MERTLVTSMQNNDTVEQRGQDHRPGAGCNVLTGRCALVCSVLCSALLVLIGSASVAWPSAVRCAPPASSAAVHLFVPLYSRTDEILRISSSTAAMHASSSPAGAAAAAGTVAAALLPTLSFTAACAPGFGPASGIVGANGTESWTCTAGPTDEDAWVWKQSNGRNTSLDCAPCPIGAYCAGGDAQPCPPSTFASERGSTLCQPCPDCCADCDRHTGACASGSPPGCLIDGRCVKDGSVRALSDGCARCSVSHSPNAWSEAQR